MRHGWIGRLVSCNLMAFCSLTGWAMDHPQPVAGAFATPVTDVLIDDRASAEWMSTNPGQVGSEHPLANPTTLRQRVWTQTTAPYGGVVSFGASSEPGTRYLRLGFQSAIPVGSVLVRGGGQLSVLRPEAAYPGNLADDSQWIPAQRLLRGQVSLAEVEPGGYAIWLLPPNTHSRALRFTHTASATDSNFAGVLGGVYLLAGRFENLAPLALPATRANNHGAPLLVDEVFNDWLAWDNGPEFPHPITDQTPEWITLTWSQPVSLQGLAALWAGFNGAEAQVFVGPNADPDANPNTLGALEAADSNWQTVARLTTRSQYPRALGVDWIDFGKVVLTRAVRLRITQVTDETHNHLIGKTKSGNRIWLGELMAVAPVPNAPLAAVSMAQATAPEPHPPIPIRFTLDGPANVTLVIEDAQGNRVRNLVSDTPFPAGANTAWWDGADDLGRNADAANHGVYLIPTHLVAPGHYTVRGLTHKAIDLHYEFSIYSAGNPAWETADGKGGWLTNHTPPSAALFLPAEKAPGGKDLVYLGSYVSEGGAGLAWVDLDGNKQGGRGWIGGAWTAAPFLASDTGPQASKDVYAYVGAGWWVETSKDPMKNTRGEIRLTGLSAKGDQKLLTWAYDPGTNLDRDENGRPNWTNQMQGLAVRNQIAVMSLTRQGKLLFVDTATRQVLGTTPIGDPRGLAFDGAGNLLVLSGKQLLRLTLPPSGKFSVESLSAPQTVIPSGLEDPVGITVDTNGDLYISDRGSAHQVKVFSAVGKLLRSIGHAGAPTAGVYDPMHLNHPRGLAIDSARHLWVTEEDFQPKRVSVWTLDGQLVKAFYGPPEYGGGGSLDPADKTKFYYHAMEFKLDWTRGVDSVASVLYRTDASPATKPNSEIPLPPFTAPTDIVHANGHRYFTNAFLGHPTFGVSVGVIYGEVNGTLRPVAAMGRANDWPLLAATQFLSRWPAGIDPKAKTPNLAVLFSWTDSNGNGQVDPEEVTFARGFVSSVTVMPDLAMIGAFVDGKAMRYPPASFTTLGAPLYDLLKGEVLATGAQRPHSDGGGQALYTPGYTVTTTAPEPFSPDGVGGVDKTGHRWSYPSLWPGLHPAHSAPVADHPGELIGTTRLLGGFVQPKGAQTAPVWGVNGNFGNMYLFTADGLFVAQLFQDVRTGKPWTMPRAQRNMLLNEISLHDENFNPSLTQTADGQIYVVDGGRTSLVRVDGLESLRALAPFPLEVSKSDLDLAQNWIKDKESVRQKLDGPKVLAVTMRSGSEPALATLADTLKAAQWATVDRRITQVGWNGKPDVVEAAITIAGTRLFAAFNTSDPNLLKNSGAVANAPFKTGGALDLMIGASTAADPKRVAPVVGDQRLLVYLVEGKPHAMLYRAVMPGTRTPVAFSSPGKSITLDQVMDVTDKLQFAASGGNYAFSIPIDTLGLQPVSGRKIKADIGILRGTGTQTIQRVYWSNKATGITSDVPTEAELTPGLWGEWVFQGQP